MLSEITCGIDAVLSRLPDDPSVIVGVGENEEALLMLFNAVRHPESAQDLLIRIAAMSSGYVENPEVQIWISGTRDLTFT